MQKYYLGLRTSHLLRNTMPSLLKSTCSKTYCKNTISTNTSQTISALSNRKADKFAEIERCFRNGIIVSPISSCLIDKIASPLYPSAFATTTLQLFSVLSNQKLYVAL